jgi:hypothetical protein
MKLSTWNWIAAVANGASAVGLGLWFLLQKDGDINFNTTLYNLHITDFNVDNPEASIVTPTPALNVTGLVMKILVVIYFLFTTFFHILYATDAFGTGAYSRAIASQNNWFRWIEYAISSTIMTFLIALICGVKSLDAVILLVIMNIGMIICGQIVEAASGPNATNIKIVASLIGWVLLAGIITIFFKSFFTGLADAKTNNFKVPTWVYLIIFPLIAWYASFGFVSLWQAFGSKHNIQQYLKIEKAYILLSLFSKINLGYFIAFGLTRPDPEKNE